MLAPAISLALSVFFLTLDAVRAHGIEENAYGHHNGSKLAGGVIAAIVIGMCILYYFH